MIRVYFALGSNVGDREGNIKLATEFLSEKVNELVSAPLYESKSIHGHGVDFYNTVVKGTTMLSPAELFSFINDVEQRVGRVFRFQGQPREIDIDILFYGDTMYKGDGFEIPHPRLSERDFVLKPLMDLDPNFVHPTLKKTVRQLYEALPHEKLSIVFIKYPSGYIRPVRVNPN